MKVNIFKRRKSQNTAPQIPSEYSHPAPPPVPPPSPPLPPMNANNSTIIDCLQAPTWSTPAATKALQRELRRIHKTQCETPEAERGWSVDMDALTNLYQWKALLFHFDESLPLQQDLKAKKVTEGIVLDVRFGPDYPQSPPYIRVVKPRLLQFANGGGGHVTAGGSICMELLTTTGWNPKMTMESVLLSVKLAISSVDPQPARLDSGTRWKKGYSAGEAMQSYVRVANQHGWGVPGTWYGLFNS
ncbi:uncharacterized protein SPPG_07070 [Spizellomyces punctatus DAOM BR117]|uniref:UBC core domain-containing protein n=1 Tax=Spizellomyces punctatus (strain DAOM BR117) TaxID=645134 RepID=A0A0L0H9D0_SPIPD|nr:uncharacterized protein SPPG_07070 [Spizellomyces punctatus DAOM BR117]KNC97601.1 hypothetical protein SPPG_07070 [Spizellomyces punctatus DAOM BR117]|eukprot:XP_016605641.1 hypothetical protein SPPG_07070 [Spizellomyces punctatus DAOM BR117]